MCQCDAEKTENGATEIDEFLALITSTSDIVPLSVEVHEDALELLDKYQFSWYDPLIVSAAIESDCDALWSPKTCTMTWW